MHGMKGYEVGVLLVIVIALIIAVIALFVLSFGTPLRERLLATTLGIEVTKPDITLAEWSCDGESCSYSITLKGMAMESQAQPIDALIAVAYKGQRLLFACPVEPQPNGACSISSEGIEFDLAPTFSGSIWAMPPTLNASGMQNYNGGHVLIDDQKIALGNFSVTFSYFELPTIFLKDRARYLIKCADDSRIAIHGDGDTSRYTMCDGNIQLTTVDINSAPNKVCIDISTSGGKPFTTYDTVNIALWNTTLLDCANLSFSQPILIAEPVELSEETALRCFQDMLVNWDLNMPVPAWDPNAHPQPAC